MGAPPGGSHTRGGAEGLITLTEQSADTVTVPPTLPRTLHPHVHVVYSPHGRRLAAREVALGPPETDQPGVNNRSNTDIVKGIYMYM